MTQSLAVQALVALAPLLVIGTLLAGLRWPARRAMPLGYVFVVAGAAGMWGVEWRAIAASSIQGLIIALSLLYIVFGALLLLSTLTASGAIVTIRSAFTRISPTAGCRPSSSAGCSAVSSKVKTIIPMTYYCLAAGALAFIWIHGPGLNAGTAVLALLLAAGLALVASSRGDR
jgi:hypothetical protein